MEFMLSIVDYLLDIKLYLLYPTLVYFTLIIYQDEPFELLPKNIDDFIKSVIAFVSHLGVAFCYSVAIIMLPLEGLKALLEYLL